MWAPNQVAGGSTPIRDDSLKRLPNGKFVARHVAAEEGDPDDCFEVSRELKLRETYEAPIKFDFLHTPLNPWGRTGLKGRGCLKRWGPNHLVESIITRFHPSGQRMDDKFFGVAKEKMDATTSLPEHKVPKQRKGRRLAKEEEDTAAAAAAAAATAATAPSYSDNAEDWLPGARRQSLSLIHI